MALYGNSITKTTSTAAAPICTLSTGTARDVRVFEIAISVSTAASGEIGIMRPANSPTVPTGGQVGAAWDNISGAGVAVTANAWTTAPTAGTAMKRMVLPATIGAGVIWSFPQGLVLPTSSYLVVWQFSAVAVAYSVSFTYDE